MGMSSLTEGCAPGEETVTDSMMGRDGMVRMLCVGTQCLSFVRLYMSLRLRLIWTSLN